MGRRAGSLGFWAVTIILVIVTAFCCVGTVMSRTDFSRAELEKFYREWEKQLTDDITEYLGQQGYENSGVTLTRVVDGGGRQYTFSIHHREIMELDDAGRKKLGENLSHLLPEDEKCTFSMNFF